MERYNPNETPNPEEWLELSEFERIDLVEEFHEKSDDSLNLKDNQAKLHASVHVTVENQIAQGLEPVLETIDRLIREGLDRHDAVHAVGAVVAENIFAMMRGKQSSWNEKSYGKRLRKLTAKRFLKGVY